MPEQREIKFRAWVKTEGLHKMYYLNGFIPYGEGWKGGNPGYKFYELYFGEKGFMTVRAEEVEIMQYTGLKDKNGKEIYDGDIVRNPIRKGVVKIGLYELFTNNGICCYCAGGSVITTNKDGRAADIKIVGNIYENANLLTHA